jgi:amino acid permease
MFPAFAATSKFSSKHPILAELLFRTAMVLATYVVTMLVPNLKTLLSLIGCICSTVLCFVYPSICELLVEHNKLGGISCWTWLKNSVILLIALVAFVMGGALNLKDVVESYTN